MRKRKKKDKGSVKEVLSIAVLLAAVCVFVFSAYQLAMMLVPYFTGGKEYDDVKKLAITVEKNVDNEEEDIFKVDFEALRKENPDTVAWLRFDEPEIISYPIVKSADNNEYLTKTFTANDNKLGSIFMDMRNESNFSNRNTFIYGHNLKVGGEMFSQMDKYASEDFCKNNPYFYIYTPDGEEHKYKIFSAAVVKDTAESYQLEYATDQEFEQYIQACRDVSNYQVDVPIDAKSKIVSLSTCTNINDDERFLVHGVLVEEE